MSEAKADFMDISKKEEKAMGKVCAIMCMNLDLGIFLVDLGVGVKDANEFIGIQPNVRIMGEHDDFLFYVANGSLYLFRINDVEGVAVHSIELQHLSELKDYIFDKTCFPPCGRLLAPKFLPTSLAYGDDGKVLIFSTQIRYHFFPVKMYRPCDDLVFPGDEDLQSEGESEYDDEFKIMVDTSVIDFELYDTQSGASRPLPQLLVCCKQSRTDFTLYDSGDSTCYDEFPGFRKNPFHLLFSIVAFAVDGDTFIIETDFGKMFSLNLQLDGARWRLCEDQGYEFDAGGKSVVTPHGICLDDTGANDSRKKWLQSRSQSADQHRDAKRANLGDGRSRHVRFPDMKIDKHGLGFPCGRAAFDLLKDEDDTSFMLRCIAGDAFPVERFSTELYMCVDVLKLNLKGFPDDQDDKDENFVELITRFIFTVSETVHIPMPLVARLFCC